MKLPFIKYIEALIICKYSVDVIVDRVKALNVPISDKVTDKLIAQIYESIYATNPTYFSNIENKVPNMEWLERMGVKKLVAKELNLSIEEGYFGLTGAEEILKDPSMYLIMTSLGLAKVNDYDIELIINSKFNIHFTSDDIKEFLIYYFNTESWTLSEKKDYVKKFIKEKKLLSMYELALEGDKDYLIWKLGIVPERSMQDMIRDMSTDAFYLYKETIKKAPEAAQKWGQLMLKLADKQERISEEANSKHSLFETVTFVINGESPFEKIIDRTGEVVESKLQKRFTHMEDLE